MHPFSTDSNERKTVPVIIIIFSIPSAWGLSMLINFLELNLPYDLPFWCIEVPSVFGFYGFYYYVFDKYLWKSSILSKIGLIKVPDIGGIWTGTIKTSFDNFKQSIKADIEIRQNWSKICFTLKTGNSTSYSQTASIITENENAIHISYEYVNEPDVNSQKTMHMHRGTARLTLLKDRKIIEGDYYTGRDRTNFGILKFSK